MRVRVAKKIIKKWARGQCSYTYRQWHTVLNAYDKLRGYYLRRGNSKAWAALPKPPKFSAYF